VENDNFVEGDVVQQDVCRVLGDDPVHNDLLLLPVAPEPANQLLILLGRPKRVLQQSILDNIKNEKYHTPG
jgi:hypothetical protein